MITGENFLCRRMPALPYGFLRPTEPSLIGTALSVFVPLYYFLMPVPEKRSNFFLVGCVVYTVLINYS